MIVIRFLILIDCFRLNKIDLQKKKDFLRWFRVKKKIENQCYCLPFGWQYLKKICITLIGGIKRTAVSYIILYRTDCLYRSNVMSISQISLACLNRWLVPQALFGQSAGFGRRCRRSAPRHRLRPRSRSGPQERHASQPFLFLWKYFLCSSMFSSRSSFFIHIYIYSDL